MKTGLIAALLAFGLTSTAFAGDAKLGDISIKDAFARATAGKAKVGISFMMIKNEGTADKLVGVSAPVSKTAELHTHIMDGDIMRMREIEGGIEVPAGGSVMLKPGGDHVMLMGLTQQLKKGESFPLEMTFEKAGKVTVTVDVASIGAKMAPGMDHSKMGHDHKDHSHN